MSCIETTHSTKKAQKILDEHTKKGDKLKSVVMADLASRYDMVFEPAKKGKKYEYIVVMSHFTKKVNAWIEEYESKGYRLAFHLASDLATAHSLIFEKIHSTKDK